jgi:transcriptional regulator with XRE-family HTH domain
MADNGRSDETDPRVLANAQRWRVVLAREVANRGLTAEALADRTGLSERQIANWLGGRIELTVTNVEFLLKAMALPLNAFLIMVAETDPDELMPQSLDPWVIRALQGYGK